MNIVVIGGGAAGFFGAIRAAECNPSARVLILERGKDVLSKVRLSGGGRCNLTHACFVPKELVTYYPRGGKELLGPFHEFGCGDTVAWFEGRGVKTKIEENGRIFAVSKKSPDSPTSRWMAATRWFDPPLELQERAGGNCGPFSVCRRRGDESFRRSTPHVVPYKPTSVRRRISSSPACRYKACRLV